ncbi:hypothetical protein [Dietzia natronolimnaea]|uniref:hypothetical protein n=1 Tax=Dietzia natronolimnaea TaxID=161920 RepID=UPI0015FB9574|nr:hypothetical protein [Dietzia natronolimnaea]MBB1037386.1 hypothetical protein [Dietzia natronolimnaea]
MIDFDAARSRYTEKIDVRRERQEANAAQPADPCDHTWQMFRETIRSDNDHFQGTAHYRVKACPKCRSKKRVELVVET